MKTLTIILSILFCTVSWSQTFEADTAMANRNFILASEYENKNDYDTALIYFKKASDIYEKHGLWREYLISETKHGEALDNSSQYDSAIVILTNCVLKSKEHINSIDTCMAKLYFALGSPYYHKLVYDTAISNWSKALKIYIKELGENHKKVANIHNNIGVGYYDKRDYDLAIEHYTKSLDIRKKLYGEKHKHIAESYSNIGGTYTRKLQYDLALEYLNKSLQLYIELNGEQDKEVAWVHGRIGVVFEETDQFDQALKHHNKSLSIYQDLYGYDHIKVALTKENIGVLYSKMNQYDLALSNLREVANIYHRLPGENKKNIMDVYHNLGAVYNEINNPDSALYYYQASLQIAESLFGSENIDVAVTKINMANIYSRYGQLVKATQFYIEAQDVIENKLGSKHVYVAIVCLNLGSLYQRQDEYDLGLEYFFKALSICKDVYGNYHSYVAGAYGNIANIYMEIDRYAEAIHYHEKALEVQKKLLGPKHLDVAKNYTNMGSVLIKLHEFDLAYQYQLAALQIRKEILGESHADLADNYNLLGIVNRARKEYDLAIENYNTAMKLVSSTDSENDPRKANFINNIGSIYFDMEQPDKAIPYFQKALAIDTSIYGQKHSKIAMRYANIGGAYFLKKDYQNSLLYYNKALKMRIGIWGEKHSDVALIYRQIASVYSETNKFEKSLKYLQKGLVSCIKDFNDSTNISKCPTLKNYHNWNEVLILLKAKAEAYAISSNFGSKHVDLIQTSDAASISLHHFQACDTLISQVRRETTTQADKLVLGNFASKIYPQAIDLCLRLDETELAFTYSEKNKAAVLSESMAGIKAKKFAGIPDYLLAQEHKLSNNMAVFKRVLAEQPDSAKEILFQDKLFGASRSYDSLMAVFENDYPKYYDMKYGREPVRIIDIQNQLDQETALVEYTLGDSSLFIFVVNKINGLTVEQVPIDSLFFDQIDYLLEALVHDRSVGKGPATLQEQFLKYSPSLYEKLILPIENEIANTENLIIIPDRELLRLPFDVLFKEKTNLDNVVYNSLDYLAKTYNISYHYSASLWHNEMVQSKKVDKNESLIAFAPVFEPSQMHYYGYRESGNSIDELRPIKVDSIFALNKPDTSIFLLSEAVTRHDTMPLPQSKEEVFSVYTTFNKKRNKCQVYYYGAATESNFKTNIDGFDIVHIASHSTANAEKPELSYISFAREQVKNSDEQFRFIPEENEGKLYSGEIYNLNLDANLVVMSSCQSGVGKMVQGEGMMSVTRGFLYAGAANVIYSLWPVDDSETKNLMASFYANIKSKKRGRFTKALSEAKRNMIQEGGNRFTAPHWSAFQIIGVD